MRWRWAMLFLVPNWLLVWYAAGREADWIGTLSAWAAGILFGVYQCYAWTRRPTSVKRIPCAPITCPPSEEFTIEVTLIRCPECGVTPSSCHSIFVEEDHELVWTCPTHGVIDIGELHRHD